jgi:hypothetical protein
VVKTTKIIKHSQVAEGTRDPSLKWKGKFTGSSPVLTAKLNNMKHKIIKTDNYLIILSDEEIKEGEACKDGYGNILPFADLSEYGLGYDRNTIKKIIAHLPLNNSPILEGVDLLPAIEDDVEKLAKEYIDAKKAADDAVKFGIKVGYVQGYNKAKEKFKYTEEDMRFIIMKSFLLGVDRAQYSKEREDEIIQSLSQSKMPTHFQVLYDIDTLLSEGKVYLMTTINSQGQTVWVGKYIY